MTQGSMSLRTRMLARLVDGGTWVGRDELNTLSTCMPAIEDAIADLMVEGLLEHRQNVGYRLRAAETTRRAVQKLLRNAGTKAAAVGQPGKDFYSVGVAESRPEVGLVMYELLIPNPEPGPDVLHQLRAQAQGVVDFINSRGGSDA